MLRYTKSLRDGLRLSAEDVHVNWAPLYHDMGLFGAFLLPLLCGCQTVLIPTTDFLREPVL
jgi:acyl-CoA synthetase (AMP-forming)/AMP-acid ligase II